MRKYQLLYRKLQVRSLQLLMLLLLNSTLFAQYDYKLKFKDEQKKQPINNVLVFIDGQYIGASNQDGYISFISSKSSVECYVVGSGYLSTYFELIHKSQCQVLLLSSFTLKEVTVKSKRLDPIMELKKSIKYNKKYFSLSVDTVYYEFKKELRIDNNIDVIKGTIMAIRPTYVSSKIFKSYYLSQVAEEDVLQSEYSFFDSLPYIEVSRLFSHDPFLKSNRKRIFQFFQRNKKDVFFSKGFDSSFREIICSGVNDFYNIDIHYLFSRTDTSICSFREKVFLNPEIYWKTEVEVMFDEFYFNYSKGNKKKLIEASERIVYRLNGKDILVKIVIKQIDRPDYRKSDIDYIFLFPLEKKINKVYFNYY